MQIHRFVKFQVTVVAGLLFTTGFGEGDDIPLSKVFCTILSGWKDAMTTCLAYGGRPLTGEEIIETRFLNKINFTVWTADYVAVSNRTNDTSYYLPGISRCGYARLFILNSFNNIIEFNLTAINLGNCMKKRAYVCTDVFLKIYPDRETWSEAKASCEADKKTLLTSSLLKTLMIGYMYVHQGVSMPMELDVWIGLLDILYNHTFQGQKETGDIVKYGTLSNAEGFRTIAVNQSSEFRAVCGLADRNYGFPTKTSKSSERIFFSNNRTNSTSYQEGSRDIDSPKYPTKSNKDSPWLVFAIIVSSVVLLINVSGCALLVYKKRKFRRISSVEIRSADAIVTSTSGCQTYSNDAHGEESNVPADNPNSGKRNSAAFEPLEAEGQPDTVFMEEYANSLPLRHQDDELRQSANDAVPGARCIRMQ